MAFEQAALNIKILAVSRTRERKARMGQNGAQYRQHPGEKGYAEHEEEDRIDGPGEDDLRDPLRQVPGEQPVEGLRSPEDDRGSDPDLPARQPRQEEILDRESAKHRRRRRLLEGIQRSLARARELLAKGASSAYREGGERDLGLSPTPRRLDAHLDHAEKALYNTLHGTHTLDVV